MRPLLFVHSRMHGHVNLTSIEYHKAGYNKRSVLNYTIFKKNFVTNRNASIMKNKINRLFVLTFLMMVTTTSYLFAQSGQPKAADPTLQIARQKIDSLDKKLIEILGARERVVKEIGIYKAKNNIPSLQAARFQQVIDKGIAAGKKEDLSPEFITELLNAIHKESLRIEDALKENK